MLDHIASPQDRWFFLDRLDRGPASGRAFLAFVGPDAVGYVYLRLEAAEEAELRQWLPRTPLIQRLRVLDRFQRRGYGRELVATVEEEARREGRHRIALGVDEHQPDPIDFYLHIGYEQWPGAPIETFREVVRPDGRRERRPEFCRIFFKDLSTT